MLQPPAAGEGGKEREREHIAGRLTYELLSYTRRVPVHQSQTSLREFHMFSDKTEIV